MAELQLLGVGALLGMQHATEADHLAAMATLAARQNTLTQGMKQGAAWGLGQSAQREQPELLSVNEARATAESSVAATTVFALPGLCRHKDVGCHHPCPTTGNVHSLLPSCRKAARWVALATAEGKVQHVIIKRWSNRGVA